jgi:tetratricopeptide (TPR) repeat protein
MEDAALGLIKNMRQHSTINSQELARLESLAYASKNDFAQADKVLAEEHNRNPKDAKFAALMAELYRLMGYSVLRDSLGDPAKEAGAQKEAAIWFRKSLAALDEQLQLLTTPGANAQEISNINLRKAEIQMTMKDFDAAIGTLTALVRQEPDKPLPLLNRAISELQAGRLDAAKSDYHAVEKLLPKPSDLVCYGLAQIAQKQNDTAAEIRYDKLYLDCAPRNTPQYTNTARQLRELESRRTSPH